MQNTTAPETEQYVNSDGRAPRPPIADKAEIRRGLAALWIPGEVYELRALGSGKGIISGYFDNIDALVNAAVWCDRQQPDGIYWTLNPVDRRLLARSANDLTTYARFTSSDGDIISRHWLLVDFDVKRPAGISSTDSEHAAALALALYVRDELTAAGWSTPIYADSGNGAHLLYRIDLPNDDASRDLLKSALEALATKYGTPQVTIDKTTFNAARICKLYGTVARKGSHMAEYPHRLARIVETREGC